MKIYFNTLLFFIFITSSFSQTVISDKSLGRASVGIIGDYYGTVQNTFAIGISTQPYLYVSEKRDVTNDVTCFSILGEFGSKNKSLCGLNLDVWRAMSKGVSLSINLNYHKNSSTEVFGFKPSLGMSFYHFAIMYGYNFYIKDSLMPELKHNILTIRYYLPLWKDKRNYSGQIFNHRGKSYIVK